MLDETLVFYVKATGKDESLMRGQFTRMKLESSERTRPLENPRGSETTGPRQERRSVGAIPETTENGSCAKRGVRAGVQAEKRKRTHLSVLPVQMKSLCKRGWKICSKSLWQKTERRKSERGGIWPRRIPTLKDAELGRRYGIRESSPCAVSCSWKLRRDVRLDVELVALGSSIDALLSGDNLVLEFDLVDAPSSIHRVHHGKPR